MKCLKIVFITLISVFILLFVLVLIIGYCHTRGDRPKHGQMEYIPMQ